MFILDATLNKIKDTEEYKNSSFKNYQTVEKLEEYLKNELDTHNVISYIKSIAKIENIINDKPLNEGINIPIENLIQKINLEENKEELVKWIKFENNKQEKIKNFIKDYGIEKKLDVLIELAKVLKPISNINEKIYIKKFQKNINDEEYEKRNIKQDIINLREKGYNIENVVDFIECKNENTKYNIIIFEGEMTEFIIKAIKRIITSKFSPNNSYISSNNENNSINLKG